MRHRRVCGQPSLPGPPVPRVAQARVPRLRLGRHLGPDRGTVRVAALGGQPRPARGAVGRVEQPQHGWYRAHALGDTRTPVERERPPAHRLHQPLRHRAERYRRELPGPARATPGRGARLHQRDRRRGGGPPAGARVRRLAARGGGGRLPADGRAFHLRHAQHRATGRDSRRAQGDPAWSSAWVGASISSPRRCRRSWPRRARSSSPTTAR